MIEIIIFIVFIIVSISIYIYNNKKFKDGSKF